MIFTCRRWRNSKETMQRNIKHKGDLIYIEWYQMNQKEGAEAIHNRNLGKAWLRSKNSKDQEDYDSTHSSGSQLSWYVLPKPIHLIFPYLFQELGSFPSEPYARSLAGAFARFPPSNIHTTLRAALR